MVPFDGREGVIVLHKIGIDTDLAETPPAVRLRQEPPRI